MDLERILGRQAAWQRSRRSLSWAEKVRDAGQVRASIELMRAWRSNRPAGRDIMHGVKGSSSHQERRG
jgi:hypothetical protein